MIPTARTFARPRRRRALPATTALLVLLLVALVVGPVAAADEGSVELDTGPPGPRESVEADLDPDGEIVAARVRRHEPGPDGGRVRESVDDLDPARIPVVVRIRYELDGEQVDADELQGATGDAVVRIQLRNPTETSRPVTPASGDDEVQRDVSLPLMAEGLLELDDAWSGVRADGGRLTPGLEGATQLRWSSALFEPFAGATAEVELRGEVEDATLPRLEIDARPVTAESSDLLRVLGERASQDGTAEAVAAFIADQLGGGLGDAAAGAQELAGGLDQAREGAGEIRSALASMQEELGGGLGELEQGLARLDEGLAGIAEGLARVEDGLGEVEGGITSLGDGIEEAQAGAGRLRDDVAGPAEAAVREAWRILSEQFTVGRADPAYVDALMEVGELHALLTGEIPSTEALEELPGDEQEQEELAALLGQVAELTGEQPPAQDEDFGDLGEGAGDLEDYPGLQASLAGLADGLGEAVGGARELSDAVAQLSAGVGEIRAGVQEIRAQLDQAMPDAGAGGGGPAEMQGGLEEFEQAMRQLAEGGEELAGGIDALDEGSSELIGRLERGVGAANLDLATVEALSERASEPVESGGEEAVGGHDRYLLVLHEEEPSRGPVAALAGLGMLAATLEVLRRRLAAG